MRLTLFGFLVVSRDQDAEFKKFHGRFRHSASHRMVACPAGAVAPAEQAVHGSVELRNVAFAYPSRLDAPVFTDFSLKVAPGQTMALVGESGSGKSTVVSLLERFYDPQGGQARVWT